MPAARRSTLLLILAALAVMTLKIVVLLGVSKKKFRIAEPGEIK